jgi:hypothetical protein
VFLADAAGVSYTATNTNRFTLSDGNSDRPSYRNADADRLPWFLREPDPISHSDANPNSDLNAINNANSNTAADGDPDPDNRTAYSSSGIKYLDAVAR